MPMPMYVVMTKEDFDKAMFAGEDIEDLCPDNEKLASSDDFNYHASYTSGIETHDTVEKRIEAAKEVARYLNRYGTIALVDGEGTIRLAPNAGLRYAKGKINQLKETLREMTPEEYLHGGEFQLRTTIRSPWFFAYPLNYTDESMPVGEHTQKMDTFIHELYEHKKDDKECCLMVIQTIWLH